MNIKKLKKELGLTQKDLAHFFGMSPDSFKNSSAKKRYENALIKSYKHIKKITSENNKLKKDHKGNDL